METKDCIVLYGLIITMTLSYLGAIILKVNDLGQEYIIMDTLLIFGLNWLLGMIIFFIYSTIISITEKL